MENIAATIMDNTFEVLHGKNLEVNLIYFNNSLENLEIAIRMERYKGNNTTVLERMQADFLEIKEDILRRLNN